MDELTDQQLLRDYAERRCEAAFAELVRRNVDLVYSAALRMVCDAHSAQDVTHAVFVALARQSSQLTNRPVLSGWLHCTARNLAAKAVRTEVRRRAHEQEAAAMTELTSTAPEAAWEEIAPHLDAALGDLSEPDRDAVLLRYFERKSAREMAEILGVSDEAAQRRVTRAVERLREFFVIRGITVGASGLAALISVNATHAAPVGLALTISTALTGTAVAATATLPKAIAMTTLHKSIVTASIAVLLAMGTATVMYHAALSRNARPAGVAGPQPGAATTLELSGTVGASFTGEYLRGGERVTFSGVLPWHGTDTNMLRLEIRKTNLSDTLLCNAVCVGSRPFRLRAYSNPGTKRLRLNMECGGYFETIR